MISLLWLWAYVHLETRGGGDYSGVAIGAALVFCVEASILAEVTL